MSETWYPLALKIGERTLFLLWASDDWGLDRLLADGGRLVSFSQSIAGRYLAAAI